MKLIKTPNFKIAANVMGDENAGQIAILIPGRLDTKDYANFVSHIEFLASRGFYAIAIDPPGTWDSSGDVSDFTTTNYLQVINDLIDYFGNRPALLLGHSRGGATAMLASSNPYVSGVVVVNSAFGEPTPPDPSEIENGALPEYRDLPPGNVRTQKKRRFDLPMAYFEDGAKHDPEGVMAKFNGPKLVIHASKDEFETMEHVKQIYDKFTEPKMFLEVNCTHDYRLYPEVIKQVEQTLGEYIKQFNLVGQNA